MTKIVDMYIWEPKLTERFRLKGTKNVKLRMKSEIIIFKYNNKKPINIICDRRRKKF